MIREKTLSNFNQQHQRQSHQRHNNPKTTNKDDKVNMDNSEDDNIRKTQELQQEKQGCVV